MKKFLILVLASLFILTSVRAEGSTADQSVGKPVTFSVVVAQGTLPFTYQWFKNGVAIVGATSSTYLILAVAASDAGTYTVQVSNKAGNTLSDNGVITITVNPSGATVQISAP